MLIHTHGFLGGASLSRRGCRGCIASISLLVLVVACAPRPNALRQDCPEVSEEITAERLAPFALTAPRSASIFQGEPFSSVEAARLSQAFRETLPLTGATAGSIAVARAGGGVWTASIGVPSEGPQAFGWASVGKLATATIILQMVEQGRLSLDQTIAPWFPDYPAAERITIDQLLTHTGGVFTYNGDRKLRRSAGYHSPEELLATAARHGPDFCSGTQWGYSNTGYVMLGQIAEKVDGAPLADIVARRLARPLGLGSLKVVTTESAAKTLVPYMGQTSPNTMIEVMATNAGAGSLAAEPVDMLRFLQAWVEGELLRPKTREHALRDLFAMFGTSMGYGRGVMVIPVPDKQRPTVWVGHLGGSPDAKGVLIYDVERAIYVALVLNTGGEGEALVNTVLKALDGG